MAKELAFTGLASGLTLTAELWMLDSIVRDGLPAPEQGMTGEYFADMPGGLGMGIYGFRAVDSGGVQVSEWGQIAWDGLKEVTVLDMAALMASMAVPNPAAQAFPVGGMVLPGSTQKLMTVVPVGADVTMRIPFKTMEDVAFVPASASFRLLDGEENELCPSAPLTLNMLSLPTPTDVAVTALGTYNQMAMLDLSNPSTQLTTSNLREVRVFETTFVDVSGNTVIRRDPYMVQVSSDLKVMQNSFQNYETALMFAMQTPNIPAFNNASTLEKKAALTDAFYRIAKLRWNEKSGIPSLVLGVTQFVNATDEIVYGPSRDADMALINPRLFYSLPPLFTETLRRAQIVQANDILDIDSIEARRQGGLMSETIGESSNMYRSGKPLMFNVSRRTLQVLSRFTQFGIQIGRRG